MNMNTLIDNFNEVEKLLDFSSPDEFYFLEIIRRRKDFSTPNEDILGQQVLATYCVKNLEQLQRLKNEIITLCEFHHARAYINLNPKSMKKTGILMMNKLLKMVENDDFHKINACFASAAGECNGIKDRKRFVIDIDSSDESVKTEILDVIHSLNVEIISVLPTPNGCHIIAKPFDCLKFMSAIPQKFEDIVEIKHNSPTVLYFKKDA